MDNGVPPTDERPGGRAAGATAATPRVAGPPDPRHEGTGGGAKSTSARNGNGARNGQTRNINGSGAKKKSASKNAKRGQQASRVHAPPAPRAEPVAVAVVEAPEATPTPVADPTAEIVETPVIDAPVIETPVIDAPVIEVPVATAEATEAPVAERDTQTPHTVAVDAADVAVEELDAADVDTSATPSTAPDVAFASSDLADLLAPETTSRVPFLLPPIVPAEPSTGDTVTVPEVAPMSAPEFSDTDGTDGLPSLLKPKKPARALRAPVVRQRRRPRVRRVTRVVRHVDTWSVFKVALVFNLFLYGVLLTAGVLLWQVAQNTGTVDNIERFFESFGWQTFELKGGEIFHNSWIAGLFLVVGLTGGAVLMATLFNLIADLVGGIRVSVLEEEVVERDMRGTGWRRSSRRVVIPADPPEPT